MRLLFEENENLLYHVHPFTMTVFLLVILILSLLFTHPLYLSGLLIVVASSLLGTGHYRQWKGYLKYAFPMVLLIISINTIFVRAGTTILFSGPRLPVIGKIRISLEAIAYGMGMSLRLLTIVSLFCLFTYMIQPDRFMKMFSGIGTKSVFIIILAIRLFPLMADDYRRIMEVQRCRGVKIDSGNWIDKTRNLLPMASVLLLSSLERSFQQAESMVARGYGSGKRTVFQQEVWRLRDVMIIATSVLGFICGIGVYLKGYAQYAYYPRLSAIHCSEMAPLILIFLLMLFPMILNWGWGRWVKLRLRI